MLSTLSEGQVLVPVHREYLVTLMSPRKVLVGAFFVLIACLLTGAGFVSTPIDGSSLGEVVPLRDQTPRSESTASFQSATESPGELVAPDQFSTADDLTTQLESE